MARIEFQGDGPVTGSSDFFTQQVLDAQGVVTNTSGTLVLSGNISVVGDLEISGAGAPITEVTGADNFHVKQVLYASGSVSNPDGDLIFSSSASQITVSGNLLVDDFATKSTSLVNNLNSDLLDSQEGSYYLDSDNFTGDYWVELTDSGSTGFHKHSHLNLDDIGNHTHIDIDSHISSSNIHFTESSIDHDNILNSGDHTHADVDTHISSSNIHFIEASIDHGSISGNEDDDHELYFRTDGNKPLTGTLYFDGKTSLYPSLKRDSSSLQARLADDSNFADLSVKNLNVTGDLSVAGSTIVVSSSNLIVDDPLTIFAMSQSGVPTPTFDAGFVVERGTIEENKAFIWDESADEFAFISTPETGSTAGDVIINSYTDVRCASLSATLNSVDFTGSDWGELTDAGATILHKHSHTILDDKGTNTHNQIDSHISDSTLHFTEASIDHSNILNSGDHTHADVDIHISSSNIHFTEASIDHSNILNSGDHTHADVDTHISSSDIHFIESSIDHVAILNSGDHTHVDIDSHISSSNIHFTEASIDHSNILNSGDHTHVDIDSHISSSNIHFTEASIDHGSISGNEDDDHEHYFLADGTRVLSGNLEVTGSIINSDGHLILSSSVGSHIIVSGNLSVTEDLILRSGSTDDVYVGTGGGNIIFTSPIITDPIEFPEDGGLQTLFDMPVSVSASSGEEMSVAMAIDSNTITTIYAEGNGLGSIQSASFKMMSASFQGTKGADIASADTVWLENGNYFDITGTTTINHISKQNWQPGSVVILQFDASTVVNHSASGETGSEASILLAGAINFSASVDDTLTFVFDGEFFREIARTVI